VPWVGRTHCGVGEDLSVTVGSFHRRPAWVGLLCQCSVDWWPAAPLSVLGVPLTGNRPRPNNRTRGNRGKAYRSIPCAAVRAYPHNRTPARPDGLSRASIAPAGVQTCPALMIAPKANRKLCCRSQPKCDLEHRRGSRRKPSATKPQGTGRAGCAKPRCVAIRAGLGLPPEARAEGPPKGAAAPLPQGPV
jgi:hypothetical protein